MTKKQAIKDIKLARKIHIDWKNDQCARRLSGLKNLPNAGSESWHLRWIRTYDKVLSLLEKKNDRRA